MQLCGSLNILWHCHTLVLEWKQTFSSPVATAEISKFANILNAALSQHHLLGFSSTGISSWNSSTGIPPPPLALFIVMFHKAHLTSHSRMSGFRWVSMVPQKLYQIIWQASQYPPRPCAQHLGATILLFLRY